MILACSVIRIARTMGRTLVLALLLAAVSVPLAHGQDATTTEATPPVPLPDGVTIAGVPVGGMTPADAELAVRAWFRQPFRFTFRGHVKTAAPWRVGGSPRVAAALANAAAAAPGTAVDLSVRVNSTRLRAYVARLAKSWNRAPVNSRARLRGLRPVITRAHLGFRIRRHATRLMIRGALASHVRGPLAVRYRTLRPRLTRSNFGPVIVVRRGSHRLYLYRGSHFRRSFGVAVGMPQYPTPLGSFWIASMQRNPWWYPPATSWAAGASPIPPGPGNPLGTRWIGLSRGGIGIHGTPDAASIGYSASHGCIRMRIPEAEWLFERVHVGTPVFIASA
jgi:L,D-transpeptidase catalytic domain/Putative peptidoglycan binding domain